MSIDLITHVQTDSPIDPIVIETALVLEGFTRGELLVASQKRFKDLSAAEVVKLIRLLTENPAGELVLVAKEPPCQIKLTAQGKEFLRAGNDRRLQGPAAPPGVTV